MITSMTFGEHFDSKVFQGRKVMIIRFAGYRSRFILVMAVAVLLPIMPMRAEAEDSPAYEFLKRVACGLLELDIQCDFLSAENARNTLNAYLALLSQNCADQSTVAKQSNCWRLVTL
jgi:hypothetical protein